MVTDGGQQREGGHGAAGGGDDPEAEQEEAEGVPSHGRRRGQLPTRPCASISNSPYKRAGRVKNVVTSLA